MNKVSFWDILSAMVVIFSGVNLFWGDKIPLFNFAEDPQVKGAMIGVSVYIISKLIGGIRKN